MNARVIETVWAWPELMVNPIHEELVRELLSLDMLCPISSLWEFEPDTGDLIIRYRPSAMSWSRKFEWPWAIQKGDIQWDHCVLDAGSGHSVFKYALASRCREVHSLDKDTTAYELIAKGRPFRMNPNIKLVEGDLRELPYVDHHFDAAFTISVLEHLGDDRQKAVSELIRVVKPGRPVLLTMDVTVANPTADFPITIEEANALLEPYGGKVFVPERACCQIFDETKLLCLCVKLIKEI